MILDAGKEKIAVEMILHAEHKNTFMARDQGNDAYACIDGCMHKLERQITEHKDKFRNRKHPSE